MSKKRRPYDVVKRGIDIVGAGTGLVLLSPVIGVTAVFVRAKLGSPIIFKQDRPGQDGKIFKLYKFRSMLSVDEEKSLVSNEQRMTQFGRKLRSTSLDELPSLWNVLRGDMSLVGPRPLLVRYLDKYSTEQARRHDVRPGITGLAQVNGRNVLEWDSRFTLDVQYVDARSFSLDFQILLKTIVTAMRREGIASEGHVVGAPFTGVPNTTDDSTQEEVQRKGDDELSFRNAHV